MKYLLKLFVLSSLILFASCDIFESEGEDPNDLGGDTDIALNEVGNEFGGSVNINGISQPINESIEIVENENGIISVKVDADVSNIPALASLLELAPSDCKGADGILDANLKFKVTSEGLQDFINPDKKAYTIVKYDDGVGTKYQLKLDDGETITREIVDKSTTDDFEYGFYYIKTTTIEQTSTTPGIEKYIIKANHKFGLVYAEALLEDGSSVGIKFFPSNY